MKITMKFLALALLLVIAISGCETIGFNTKRANFADVDGPFDPKNPPPGSIVFENGKAVKIVPGLGGGISNIISDGNLYIPAGGKCTASGGTVASNYAGDLSKVYVCTTDTIGGFPGLAAKSKNDCVPVAGTNLHVDVLATSNRVAVYGRTPVTREPVLAGLTNSVLTFAISMAGARCRSGR